MMVRYIVGLATAGCCALGVWPTALGVQASTLENCARAQNSDDAIRACDEVISSNPREAAAYRHRGNAYYLKGDYDRAIADYSEAVKLNPRDADAYGNRGKAHYLKGDYPRAREDFLEETLVSTQDAVKRASEDVTRLHHQWKRDHYDGIMAAYSKAIRLNPRDVDAYRKRGIAFKEKGDYERAIVDYSEVIRLHGEDIRLGSLNPLDERVAEALTHRAVMYALRGDYDRAIADANEAIKLNPRDPETYCARGFVYMVKGSYDAAITDLTELINSNAFVHAGFPYAGLCRNTYAYRGHAHGKKGDNARAMVDLNYAIRFNPLFVPAYVWRGETQEAMSDRAEAVRNYSRALALPVYDRWELDRQADAKQRLEALKVPQQR